jgi:alpha/beta superfamily hydrolase
MDFNALIKTPGHHELRIHGPAGMMEVVISIPENCRADWVALVAHPHPLQEGTMNNKVVTTTGRALLTLQIPVIRFNFRGVGTSEGQFDHGIGETEDLLFLMHLWQHALPEAKWILAGFSFGSFVAFRAAQEMAPQYLILIAPPVHRFAYELAQDVFAPTVIFQGSDDEVVPAQDVAQFAKRFNREVPMEWFEHTGHFFHGKLIDLRTAIDKWIKL